MPVPDLLLKEKPVFRQKRRTSGSNYLKKMAGYFYAHHKTGIAGPLFRAAKVADAISLLSEEPGSRKANDRSLALKARANAIREVLGVTMKLRSSVNEKNKRIGSYLELALKDALL
jgi:hypothetical protein